MSHPAAVQPPLLDRLTALLSGWATRRTVLLVVALELIMTAVLLPLASTRLAALSNGVGPLDSRFYYTPAEAYAAFDAYGAAGRAFDLNSELTVNLVYPLVYSLFFSLATLYFLARAAPGRAGLARLALLPFLALVADYVENAGLIVLLLTYPAQMPALAAATGFLTSTKWALQALSLIVLAASAGGAVLARRQRVDPAQS